MASNTQKKRYFVAHLEQCDRPASDKAYQVQILNSSGRADVWGYVGDADTELIVEGHCVPSAVVTAARRQLLGKGDYVDEDGNSIRPF